MKSIFRENGKNAQPMRDSSGYASGQSGDVYYNNIYLRATV